MTPDEQSAEMEQDPQLFLSHLTAGVTALENVCELDHALPVWAVTHQQLEELNRRLAGLRDHVSNTLGEAMGTKRVTVVGAGTFERYQNKTYTEFDKAALELDVMDTKLVDESTGEITEETPLEKYKHVFPPGTPRRTAIKQRGLQVDQYCTVTDKGGWKVRTYD